MKDIDTRPPGVVPAPRPGTMAHEPDPVDGEIDALLASLERYGVMPPDFEKVWSGIHRILRARSRDDPAGSGLRLLDEALAFAGLLELRARYATATRLKAWDRARRDRGANGPEPVLDDRDLTRLLELQRHLAGLVDARAAAARKWGLAARHGTPGQGRVRDGDETHRGRGIVGGRDER
ncbi:hypothetical protein [Tautonia plasticadhaerens]|uniref:Uncharacterized protein n=1 Tax=Tautonia plasticadhaerens TaxID=2527974 RepID=A0A518H687_9BACT|nr:hypothetical protein [Tautonia plasticadhaerens]QDV36357.1 hypothetical protein ElP_42770 [Tautonia plasticadhaerens]